MTHCIQALALAFLLLSTSAEAGRTLAVAYFDNTSGRAEDAALSKGLADMLITDLSQVSALTLVEREKLSKVLDELKLSKSAFVDPKSAQRLGKGLSAELLMVGGFLLEGEKLRIDARVVEVATGKVLLSEKVEGKRDEFFAMEKELVEALVKSLDLSLGLSEKSALRKSQTESFEAWRRYSEGLDARDKGDAQKAYDLFRKALEADPGYRAAKTASERVQALVKLSRARAEEEFEVERKKLDPTSPKFGDQLLLLYYRFAASNEAWAVRARVSLVADMVEKNRRPVAASAPGYPPNYPEQFILMPLLSNYVYDPDALDALPSVYEYLLTKYPDSILNASMGQSVRFVDEWRAKKKESPEVVQMTWDSMVEHWKKDPSQAGLLSERAAVLRLFRSIQKKMGN